MVGLGTMIPALSFLMQIGIPETPRWLLQKGHHEKAVASLSKSAHYTQPQLEQQIEEILQIIKEESQGADKSPLQEILYPSKAHLHAMLVGWGVSIFQQANGSEVSFHTPN